MKTENILLIITSIISGLGFGLFYMLSKVNTNYNTGVGLGFMIATCEILFILSLLKLFPTKNSKSE